MGSADGASGGGVQNPYNEGAAHAGVKEATVADCPYKSSLLVNERNQWIAGFHSNSPTGTGSEDHEVIVTTLAA